MLNMDDVDRSTAIHEAAHAVLGWHRDRVVVRWVDLDQALTWWTATEISGEDVLAIMAGPMADYRALGRTGPDWAADWGTLVAEVDEAIRIATEDDWPEMADGDDVKVRQYVDKLASGTGAPDPAEILSSFHYVTSRLLDEHWAEIEAVALALIQRRRLEADDLAAILGPQRETVWERLSAS